MTVGAPGRPKKGEKPKLSIKQQRFINELPLCDWNVSEAARRAGCSKNTAKQIGHRWMGLPWVTEHLEKKMEEAKRASGLSLEALLEGYKRIAFFDSRDMFDEGGDVQHIKDIGDDAAKILGVTIDMVPADEEGGKPTVKMRILGPSAPDRKLALDSAARALGYFKDNVNLGGEVKAMVEYTAKIRRDGDD